MIKLPRDATSDDKVSYLASLLLHGGGDVDDVVEDGAGKEDLGDQDDVAEALQVGEQPDDVDPVVRGHASADELRRRGHDAEQVDLRAQE